MCSRLRGGRLFDRTRPRDARRRLARPAKTHASAPRRHRPLVCAPRPQTRGEIIGTIARGIQGAPRAAHPQPGDHTHMVMRSLAVTAACAARAGLSLPHPAPASSQAAHAGPGGTHPHTPWALLVAGERHHSYRTAAGQTRALVGAHSTRRSRASCSHGSSEATTWFRSLRSNLHIVFAAGLRWMPTLVVKACPSCDFRCAATPPSLPSSLAHLRLPVPFDARRHLMHGSSVRPKSQRHLT